MSDKNADMETIANGVQAAIEAGMKIGASESLPLLIKGEFSKLETGQIPVIGVPPGLELKSLEEYLPQPARLRQEVSLTDSKSFIAYVNRFKDKDSQIFATISERDGDFEAILDYHQAQSGNHIPRRKNHIVKFSAAFSEEWLVWIKNNGDSCDHTRFATFIEENLVDIQEPSAASVLESVRSLQINRASSFEAITNEPDGKIHYKYIETDGKNGGRKGRGEFPHEIKLKINVFKPRPGEPSPPEIGVVCRITYNLVRDEGKVKFRYDIVRPHKLIEESFAKLFTEIERGVGIKILLGKALRWDALSGLKNHI